MYELCVWWIEDGDEAFPEFHAATLEWIRSLGLDPNALASRAGVVQRGDVFVLLYDEAPPVAERTSGEDPLYREQRPPVSARRELAVESNSWPDRRAFDVPLWSPGRIAHVNLTREVSV